jgi:protein SCO1
MKFPSQILVPVAAAAVLLSATVSCTQENSVAANTAGSPPATAGTNQHTYQVKGVIKELKPDGKTVEIRHEEVLGYMPAMTMPFEARDPKELKGLQAGDTVSFRMTVTDTDGWIDQITKLNTPKPAELPSRANFRIVRDVEPLKEGDPLPEYHFTNELGQVVSTSQLKGQALAFTFFFTRCPYPTFCPLMSINFKEVQTKLLAMPDGPKNWHLFSISFDPENDPPAALKAYAARYDYNPEHWNFLTGELIDITAIGEQVGETFWHDGASISHNLRTVVVDTRCRVQKSIPENKWTSDELVAEMVKAAAVKE